MKDFDTEKQLGQSEKILFSSDERTEIAVSLAALLIALLFHILLFAAVPYEIKIPTPEEKYELQVEVVPPELEMAHNIPEFIEANPMGNQQRPDEFAPESFQDQRAAEELPDPSSTSRRPYVEGEVQDGQKIVSGTNTDLPTSPQEANEILERPLAPNTPAFMAVPESETSQHSAAGAPKKSDDNGDSDSAKKTSSPDGEKSAPNEQAPEILENAEIDITSSPESHSDKDGSALSKKSEKDSEKDEGKEEKNDKNSQAKESQKEAPDEPAIDENLPAPRPRPQLSMRTPPGPLADNRSRASNQGLVSADSKFSEFGAYQQRMIEAISRQWNLLGMKSNLTGTINSQVVIEFMLNNRGELTRIEILFSNSTNTGRELCKMSILSTAPYGEWTQEMVSSLGLQDQSVRITFHYR